MSEVSSPIDTLLKSDWEYSLSDNPEFSSQAGFHQHSTKLQDLSPAAFQARLVHDRQVLTEVKQLLQTPEGKDSLALQLLEQDLANEIASFELGTHLYPVNSIGYGGVVNNFIEALEWLPDTEEEGFVARLEAFPAQVTGYISLLQAGLDANEVASQAMVRKVETQLQEVIDALAPVVSSNDDQGDSKQRENDHLINQRLAKLTSESLQTRGNLAKSIFRDSIINLKEFFTAKYIPKARPQTGCGGLPNGNGEAVYAQCLAFHTTTKLSPQEVHVCSDNPLIPLSSPSLNHVL